VAAAVVPLCVLSSWSWRASYVGFRPWGRQAVWTSLLTFVACRSMLLGLCMFMCDGWHYVSLPGRQGLQLAASQLGCRQGLGAHQVQHIALPADVW